MTFKHVIIDVSNLFFRCYFTHKDQTTKVNDTEIVSGGIYGFIRSIQKIQREYCLEDTKIWFLADNFASKDNLRVEFDPEYKINRVKYSDDFYRSIDLLLLILLNFSNNFSVIQVTKFEADDLLPSVISLFDKYDRVLIISNDLDYSRCISDTTYLLMNNVILTPQSFNEKYGFYPTNDKVVLYKSIRGDKSDNIAIGVKGIREDKVLYLLNKYKDVYDLLHNVSSEVECLGEKLVKQIQDSNHRLILNHQLVSFIEISTDILKENIKYGEYNPKILRSFYKMLNFSISEIDKRLLNEFPDKPTIVVDNTPKGFFNFQEIQRKN